MVSMAKVQEEEKGAEEKYLGKSQEKGHLSLFPLSQNFSSKLMGCNWIHGGLQKVQRSMKDNS